MYGLHVRDRYETADGLKAALWTYLGPLQTGRTEVALRDALRGAIDGAVLDGRTTGAGRLGVHLYRVAHVHVRNKGVPAWRT